MNEETASNEFIGQLATLTGWTLKSETVSPYVLKKADVMVLKNEGCLVHDGPGQLCVEAVCGVNTYLLLDDVLWINFSEVIFNDAFRSPNHKTFFLVLF